MSEQIRPRGTLVCCLDVKHPTNNNNNSLTVGGLQVLYRLIHLLVRVLCIKQTGTVISITKSSCQSNSRFTTAITKQQQDKTKNNNNNNNQHPYVSRVRVLSSHKTRASCTMKMTLRKCSSSIKDIKHCRNLRYERYTGDRHETEMKQNQPNQNNNNKTKAPPPPPPPPPTGKQRNQETNNNREYKTLREVLTNNLFVCLLLA